MTLTIKNNKGEFTVSLEDFAEKFGSFLETWYGFEEEYVRTARKRLADFLQDYKDV